MAEAIVIDSPISVIGCGGAQPQISGGTMPQNARGLFAEAVALATAQANEQTDNISADNLACWDAAGQNELVCLALATGDSAATGSSQQGEGKGIFASSKGLSLLDPAAQAGILLAGAEATGAGATQSAADSLISNSPEVSATPGKNHRKSQNGVTGEAGLSSVIVAGAECPENPGRSTCPVRSGEQGIDQTGSAGSDARVSLQENPGGAGMVLPVAEETVGESSVVKAKQGSRTPGGETVTGSVTVTAGVSKPIAEGNDPAQVTAGDRGRTWDGLTMSVPGSSGAAAGSQPRGAEQMLTDSEARRCREVADSVSARLGQGESLVGTPNKPAGDSGSAGPQGVAGAKDQSPVAQTVPLEGKFAAAAEAQAAARPGIADPLTGGPGVPRDDESSGTKTRLASYEVRAASQPEEAGSMTVSSAKSAPGLSNGANGLRDASATAAEGNPQSSGTPGGTEVLDSVTLYDSLDLSSIRGQADGTKTTSSGIAGSAQDIGRQILDSMQASVTRGEREIVVRLHPPELGSVLVRFKEQDGQLQGLLEVSGSDTKREIERVLPQMLQSLQEHGMHIRRLDVTLADQMQGDSGKGQLHQDAWSRQGWGQNREPFDASPAHWSGPGTDSSAQETSDVEQAVDVSRGGIDMLL